MSPDSNAKKNPTYQEVCSGSTGHVEVFQFEYFVGHGTDEEKRRNYRELCKFFYQFHDPTTKNAQGNDHGTQYASNIFCYNDLQQSIAEDVKTELQTQLNADKIVFANSAYRFKNKEVSMAPMGEVD